MWVQAQISLLNFILKHASEKNLCICSCYWAGKENRLTQKLSNKTRKAIWKTCTFDEMKANSGVFEQVPERGFPFYLRSWFCTLPANMICIYGLQLLLHVIHQSRLVWLCWHALGFADLKIFTSLDWNIILTWKLSFFTHLPSPSPISLILASRTFSNLLLARVYSKMKASITNAVKMLLRGNEVFLKLKFSIQTHQTFINSLENDDDTQKMKWNEIKSCPLACHMNVARSDN